MKNTVTFLLFLWGFYAANACSCKYPAPIIEFQSAVFVFEGEAISKVYASDSLTFTVNFKVLKHYKKGETPAYFEFTFPSEGEYTGNYDTCDWTIHEHQRWLIFAEYRNGKITFSNNCSNSRLLNRRPITRKEQLVLDHGNDFDITKYTLTSLDGDFTSTKPETDLDSILKNYYNKDYGATYRELRADVMVEIDETGKVLSVNLHAMRNDDPGHRLIRDTIFGLYKRAKTPGRQPETSFEEDMLTIVQKLDTWEISFIEGTNIPVRIRKYLQFYKKPGNIEVYY